MTTALLLKIGAESAQLRGDLAKANNMVSQFSTQVTKVGGVIAGAFTVTAIADFVMECSKLAAEAEGVNSAFQKIPNSTKLLMDMKAATEGTVDNLTLMKLGVEAFNNNAPLKELPKILNFIDRTADATNQDFKSLADTIINNIGKESTKGLNQLGLNIQKIKQRADEIGFVPALMEEITRKSESLGQVSSENADSLDRLNASWVNYKLYLGEAANETGVLGTSVSFLTQLLDTASAKSASWWEKLGAIYGGAMGMSLIKHKEMAAQLKAVTDEQKKAEQVVREVDHAYAEFNKDIDAYGRAITTHQYRTELLAEFQRRLNLETEKASKLIENEKNLTEQLNEKKTEALELTGRSRAMINDEIAVIEEKIKKLRELSNAESGMIRQPGKISSGIKPIEPVTANTKLLSQQVQPIDQFTSALQRLNDQWMVTQTSMQTGQVTMLTFAQAWAQVGVAGIDATALINQGLADTAAGIGAAIGQMMSGVGGMEHIGAALLGGIAGMLGQLGQLAIATGVAILGIKKALETLNPAVAIAAGVALIALSKFVSNKAASLGSSGGGGGGSSRGATPITGAGETVGVGVNTPTIKLGGTFTIKGPDLEKVIEKNDYRVSRVGG